MNINVINYLFINKDIVYIACKEFKLKLVFLLKFRFLKNFDDKSITFIIHVIYSFFIIQNHCEALTFMLIIKLNNHYFILSKFWMNVHNILLNMQLNCLIFKFDRCSYFDILKAFISFSKNLFNLYFTLNFIFIKFINSLNRFTSFI